MTIGDESPPPAEPSGRVLVVDDEIRNRSLLHHLLEDHGFGVVEAEHGEAALAAAEVERPDVVLLDAMMPRLDGFEVCRRLKASPTTAFLPVIMVTSLSGRSERLQAIRAGANDFVTKPIDSPDLLLRVRNAVTMKRMYDRMAGQYRQLQEMEAMRDTLVHMLVHDLRSPLGALSAYLQLLRLELAGWADEEPGRMVGEAYDLTLRMTVMINAVLDVSRFESRSMPLHLEPVELQEVVTDALSQLGRTASGGVTVRATGDLRVTCDPQLIGRVMLNLLGNALKFSEGEARVIVDLLPAPDGVRVEVTDRGPGIAADQLPLVFEKYAQAGGQRRRTHGSGLGLAFCRLAVEAHGGTIGARSALGLGSTFWFTLPRDGPPAPPAV